MVVLYASLPSISAHSEFVEEGVGKDHIATMGSFVFAPSVLYGGSVPKRKKIDYDVAKFADATCAESFCELVRNIPPIPITVDNTSHCHLGDTFIFDALRKSSPKDTHRKRQQFIRNHKITIY